MAKKENQLDLYLVDKKYVRDLSKVDNHVMSVSPQTGKETRPFLGIIIIMDKKEYCIPLTSPKEKFNIKTKEDFVKIPDPKLKNENGAAKTIGILNINNMIPISKAYAEKIDLYKSAEMDKHRRTLLIKQLEWCRDNRLTIQNKANKVYKLVTQTPEKNRRLTARCLDFLKLEKVLEKRLDIAQGVTEKLS